MRDLFHDDKNRDSWKSWLRRFLPNLDSRIDFGMYQAQTLVVDAVRLHRQLVREKLYPPTRV